MPNDQFQNALDTILFAGTEIQSRNSKTIRHRNLTMEFDRTPLISLRRTAWKSALREFEWFLSGSSDIEDLHPSVRKWWEPWTENNYDWNNYSKQLRDSTGGDEINVLGCDQVEYLKDQIKDDPYSRRSVITTWNTAEMIHEDTKITNCHGTVIQCFVEPDNSLHMTMYQRSADMVLGVPHNLIQYWAFLQYLAHHGKREVGSFTWIGGDCHIYENHVDMAQRMIALEDDIKPINLIYKPTSEDFKADDFSLDGEYKPIIRESLEMTV